MDADRSNRYNYASLNTSGNMYQDSEESVDELRKKLNEMKRLMAERQLLEDADEGKRTNTIGIIDGSFMSAVFGVALFVILSVSLYAFYNLYYAIRKKFHSDHTEL